MLNDKKQMINDKAVAGCFQCIFIIFYFQIPNLKSQSSNLKPQISNLFQVIDDHIFRMKVFINGILTLSYFLPKLEGMQSPAVGVPFSGNVYLLDDGINTWGADTKSETSINEFLYQLLE